ncbi:MAG: hypothetical protein C3F13_06980 [Anaerolineales bacterium]|nr:hypothetical protein [Anaerolineae bacterium]PWB54490.1 MAG: hypothetical protein C3F13_06980 [Anaerolineales bacterium]
MAEEINHRYPFDRPGYYQIRIQGNLRKSWHEYLHGLTITSTAWGRYPQVTMICGWLADQAALGGLLELLNNLGVVILTVERIEEDETIH